jgi:DNA-binding helix-hairpin-helix protein with protein kinase domain
MQHALLSDSGHHLTLPASRSARLGIGGQGQVVRALLASQPVAVKLLRQPDEARLRALQLLEPSCGSCAALPLQLLYRRQPAGRGPLVGYAMRLIDPATSVSAVRLFNFEEIARLKRYTWQDAVLAALRLAEAVAELHRHGVVIGDLNPENVVFEQGHSAAEAAILRAVLLDGDSFQIQTASGQRHPCPVSRAPYTAPELIGCDFSRTWRQPATDAFSLAVLIHQLLLHDHPYDNAIHREEPDLTVTTRIRRGLYPHAAAPAQGLQASPFRPAPRQVSVELDAAFRRSFCGPPGLRPSAAEWALLLRQLHHQLVPCNRCSRHHHPRGRACLWCAVEQQLGQPLCRFSAPTRQARISERPATPPLQPASAAALLREQLEEAQQQASAHVALRASLAEQLLQLEPRLLALQQSHGSPEAWLDADALQRRLGSLRHRLSRWLGRHSRTAQREAAVAALLELASTAAAEVQRTSSELEQQRLDLLQQLARADASALADALLQQSDPALAAAEALQRAEARQREQWLLEQLAQHTIRSWRVEGFGEVRLALLERHGLMRADQLHQHIERITALPGIGKGLQNSLRQRLAAVVRQLQQHHPLAAVALADLRQQMAAVPLPVMPLQQALLRLLEQVQTLHGGADRLEQRLEHLRLQRDRQLQRLESLF